jgi:hypothetical protein
MWLVYDPDSKDLVLRTTRDERIDQVQHEVAVPSESPAVVVSARPLMTKKRMHFFVL